MTLAAAPLVAADGGIPVCVPYVGPDPHKAEDVCVAEVSDPTAPNGVCVPYIGPDPHKGEDVCIA